MKVLLTGCTASHASKNTNEKMPSFAGTINSALTELGFDETGNNTSYHNDISSNSTYFSHPQTGVKIRLSDHAPVYARSTGNDIQLYPGSYQSDDDALNSILSLIGRK